MSADVHYTPPLGSGKTADYDKAIRRWTRELLWRRAMLTALAPQSGEAILDVGCGTGSFALMVKHAAPGAFVTGLDPDAEALDIARAKAEDALLDIAFQRGFARDAKPGSADAVSSSLMFHQMPVAEKVASLGAMWNALRPGGRLVVADYGRQRGLMRVLFRQTVQRLDGIEDTQPNADGILPRLIEAAGFTDVLQPFAVNTMTGTISLFTARKPQA